MPSADQVNHMDMDTPGEFDRRQLPARCRAIPTKGECEAMLAGQRLPDAVIRHSRAVAEISGQIADALAATGLAIDPALARAGGLLHDIAKGRPQHAVAGAAFLRDCGMPAVADVVAAHTEMDFGGAIDERAIVYLADKLVSCDAIVTLEERFQPALLRFGGNQDALEAARRRKQVAERIAGAIEARLGTALLAMFDREPALPAREHLVPRAKEDRL